MDSIVLGTFDRFITSTIFKSGATTLVVLVASLYLDRCKEHFDPKAFRRLWLKETVFIVAITLAHKVSNYRNSGMSGC